MFRVEEKTDGYFYVLNEGGYTVQWFCLEANALNYVAQSLNSNFIKDKYSIEKQRLYDTIQRLEMEERAALNHIEYSKTKVF